MNTPPEPETSLKSTCISLLKKGTEPLLSPENEAVNKPVSPGEVLCKELHESLFQNALLCGGMAVILVVLFFAMGKTDRTGFLMGITFISICAALAACSFASCILLGRKRKLGRVLAHVPAVVGLLALLKGNLWGIKVLAKLHDKNLVDVLE